jgi:hypothetical protein
MAKAKKALPAPTEDQINFIKTEHAAVVKAGQEALERAISCGAALKNIQDNTEHGGWIVWVEGIAGIPRRTASHYMALYADQPAIQEAADNMGTTVAHLSVRGAKKLVKEYKDSKLSPEEKTAAEAEATAAQAKKDAEQAQKDVEAAKAKKAEVDAEVKKLLEARPELKLVPSPSPPPTPTGLPPLLEGRPHDEICVALCTSMELEDLFKLASNIVRNVLGRTDITMDQWQLYKKGLADIMSSAKTPQQAQPEPLKKTG